MICDRCGKRDATEHLSEITGMSIRAGELRRACNILECGSVSIDEVRRWMSTESYLNADFEPLGADWFERAHAHGQQLPPTCRRSSIDTDREHPSRGYG